MPGRALVLVHDPAPDRRDRIPGALLPAFSSRDIEHDVACFTTGQDRVPDSVEYGLLVIMGSEASAYDDRVDWLLPEREFVASALSRGLPALGICFGGQLLARVLGGTVARAPRGEFGYSTVTTNDSELVPSGPWLQFHADAFVPPEGTELAQNTIGSQAFLAGCALGVQFHPETTSDSFAAWEERWRAVGKRQRVDLDAIRSQVARNEEATIRQCDQLVGTFISRYTDLRTARPDPSAGTAEDRR